MVSKSKGRIVIDGERCKGCGLCIWACPKGLIGLAQQEDHRGIHIAFFDEARTCTGCAFCAIICPDVAIEVYRGRRNVKVQMTNEKGEKLRLTSRRRSRLEGEGKNVKCQSSKSK